MGKKFMGYDNASELITAIGNKIKAKYTKPNTGIPKSDLASEVQTSLDQVSTNQANISYVSNQIGKNLFDYTIDFSSSTNITITNNNDGTFKVTGGDTSVRTPGHPIYLKKGRYVLSGCPSGGSSNSYAIQVRDKNNNVVNNSTSYGTPSTFEISTEDTYSVNIRFAANYSAPSTGLIYKPMVCTEEAWNISNEFELHALPNYELTRLESEDRAALAEEIDAGAKNKLDWASAQYVSNSNCTYSKTVTSLTASAGSSASESKVYYSVGTFAAGKYVFKFKISSATISGGAYIYVCATPDDSTLSGVVRIRANGEYEIPFSWTGGTVYLQFCPNVFNEASSNTFTVSDIMICTLADWKVSQKFVPYRVPINCVFWKETNEARSTSLVTTGIKFEASKQTVYRITATALRNNSKPTSLVIKHKLGASYSENTFIQITANENDWALTACGSMVLGVGGYFEVYVQYNSAASNKVYVIVEELKLG